MNMVCRQPMTLVRTPIMHGSLNTELDRMFDWALGSDRPHTHRTGPALDVVQEEQRYVVRADLPGLGRDEVEITFQDGVLTIKGEKKQDERPENHRLHLQERFHGSFARNLRLPERVDTDKIEATMKDGVLELVLPFVPEVQPRKIVVNS
jgi:HSP20 family protein